MIFEKIKIKISLISTFESREYGRNNEVVVWRGLHYVAIKSLGKLRLKAICRDIAQQSCENLQTFGRGGGGGEGS